MDVLVHSGGSELLPCREKGFSDDSLICLALCFSTGWRGRSIRRLASHVASMYTNTGSSSTRAAAAAEAAEDTVAVLVGSHVQIGNIKQMKKMQGSTRRTGPNREWMARVW